MDPRLYRLPNLIFTMLKPGKAHPANTAVFKVPLSCSKPLIANYLEQLYRVKVKRVNTAIYLGKQKRNPFTGRPYKLSDWKKAIVTIEQEAGKEPWTYPTLEQQEQINQPNP